MRKRMLCTVLTVLLVLMCAAPCSAAREEGHYNDVPVEKWFYNSVVYCSELGIINGVGNNAFAPQTPVNRAMFVTILHRLAGSPEAGPAGFSDVPAGCYYEKAVAWAKENGIVNGTASDTFSPGKSILRQDMACMIARYADFIGETLPELSQTEEPFRDQNAVSGYAREAVKQMQQWELMQGDPNGNFRPKSTGTRAEAAAIFTRLALLLEKIPCQAILETETGTYTLSTDDTIAFYRAVSGLKLRNGAYPEYVATHTVKLWNGTYRFNFSNELFYPGFGYQYADCYAGCTDGGDAVTQTVYQLLNVYTN